MLFSFHRVSRCTLKESARLKRRERSAVSQWLPVKSEEKNMPLQVRIMYIDGIVFVRKETKEALWIWQDADGSRGTVAVALELKV